LVLPQNTWVGKYKFTELDYTPHVHAMGLCMYHGEYRPVATRDIPEGVGFANFLTDDPKLTVAARTTYAMKFDVATHRFAEEVMLDTEVIRAQYPALRTRLDEFIAINGRKPNAREMLEMALWDEKADKDDLEPKGMLMERKKLFGEDRRALNWYEGEMKHRVTLRTAKYKEIAEKTRSVRMGGRQEWEEFNPPLHPCSGQIWDRIDGKYYDGWIVGNCTIYFRDKSIYIGPYVHYCPAHIVDPPCLLTGLLSKIHLFNAESCIGNDKNRYALGRTPQPKCQRHVTHWGEWQDGRTGNRYQGVSVDNHFSTTSANGLLVVHYADGGTYAGCLQNGTWIGFHTVYSRPAR
jgi:hypothetical protein